MAIDPMLYKKYNKKDVDVGATLAQASARKSARDAAPKGVSGGVRAGMGMSGFGSGFFLVRWLSTFGRFMGREKE